MEEEVKQLIKKAIETHGDSWWNNEHEDCDNQTNRDWIVDDIMNMVEMSGYVITLMKKT
jgi:hypothetical protein